MRPALHRDYRRHFATYILRDEIADIPLTELRPLDVQLCRARLRARWSPRTKKVLSEKTVSGVINGSLRAMIRAGLVEDLLTRDPFVGLEWKSLEPPPADPFADDEWARIAVGDVDPVPPGVPDPAPGHLRAQGHVRHAHAGDGRGDGGRWSG